ncbi:MAG: DUF58 domain-containing protein [Nitrososphaerales archaeon]
MQKHIRLMIGFLGLLLLTSLALLPEATLAMLGVFLAVGLNLILFSVLRPFRNFTITRSVDKHQLIPPADIKTTLNMRYDGQFPTNASVQFECKSLDLDVNTGTIVFRPGQDYVLTQTLAAVRRGVHTISNTKVTIKDWLLLSGKTLTFNDAEEILVLPHIYPFATPPEATGSGVLGVVSSIKRGRSSEVWGIREYQPGDDYKIIAWKAMAKSPDHKPMSKIMAGEVGPAITVILDIGKDGALPNGDDTTLDIGADIAASLCYNFVQRGTRTGLAFFDNKMRTLIRPSKGEAHIDSVLRHLALVQPSLDKFLITNLSKTYLQLSSTEFGNSFVLILGRLDDRLIDSYIPKIKTARDLVVVIVHNETNQDRAEQIQEAAQKVGVTCLLASAETVRGTIGSLERWAYATTQRA